MSEWRELWRHDDPETDQRANLTQLVVNDNPVPGALVLSVVDGEAASGEAWVSLDYASLWRLRDALTDWLAQT